MGERCAGRVDCRVVLLNRNVQNQFYFVDQESVSIFAGITILIGFVLVLAVRFGFAHNEVLSAPQ